MQCVNEGSCWLITFSFQVHAEEISGNNGYVELSFCAKKLDDKVGDGGWVHISIRYGSVELVVGDDGDDDDGDRDIAVSAGAAPMFVFIHN